MQRSSSSGSKSASIAETSINNDNNDSINPPLYFYRNSRLLVILFVGVALYSWKTSLTVVQSITPAVIQVQQRDELYDNPNNTTKHELEKLREALAQAEKERDQAKEEASEFTKQAGFLKQQVKQLIDVLSTKEENEVSSSSSSGSRTTEALAKAEQERDVARRQANAATIKFQSLQTELKQAEQRQMKNPSNSGHDDDDKDALIEQAKRAASEAIARVAALEMKLNEALSTKGEQHNVRPRAGAENPEPDEKQNFDPTPISVDSTGTSESTNVLDEVIRLLLPPTEADAYIQQLPGDKFRFYVYEMPEPYDYQSVSKCIEKRYFNGSTCDWAQSICTEEYTTNVIYSKRRFNRNGDVLLAKVLSEYTGPMRTYNPEKADLFIVPYPTAGNCECRLSKHKCYEDILYEELDGLWAMSLHHFNIDTRHRHLFLDSNIYDDMHWYFRDQSNTPLVTTVGPAVGCINDKRQRNKNYKHYKFENELAISFCGQIVMPYANTNPHCQPPELQKRVQEIMQGKSSKEEIIRERPNAMAAFISAKIDGNPWARVAFLAQIEKMNYTLAGLPIVTGGMLKGRTMGSERDIQQAYQESIFCPILRGDYPPQKRFFDVMLNGCIPVVLESQSSEEGYISHFAGNAIPARVTYPFGKGLFPHDPKDVVLQRDMQNNSSFNELMGIDYSEMVVAVDEKCHSAGCMIPVLEDLIRHHPRRIRQKQKNIARFVSLLSYGMEHNGLQYPDAIATMLVQARHYVHSIYGLERSERLNAVK